MSSQHVSEGRVKLLRVGVQRVLPTFRAGGKLAVDCVYQNLHSPRGTDNLANLKAQRAEKRGVVVVSAQVRRVPARGRKQHADVRKVCGNERTFDERRRPSRPQDTNLG